MTDRLPPNTWERDPETDKAEAERKAAEPPPPLTGPEALRDTRLLRRKMRQLEKLQRQAENPLRAPYIGMSTRKKCPDCAEKVRRDAHVCKHCGYRFPTE